MWKGQGFGSHDRDCSLSLFGIWSFTFGVGGLKISSGRERGSIAGHAWGVSGGYSEWANLRLADANYASHSTNNLVKPVSKQTAWNSPHLIHVFLILGIATRDGGFEQASAGGANYHGTASALALCLS